MIASVLPSLIKNVKLEENTDYKKYENNSEDIELKPITSNSKEGLAQPLLESQIDMEKKSGKDYSWTVGHLIPLDCGHNQDLEQNEIDLYEEYVKHAGLV